MQQAGEAIRGGPVNRTAAGACQLHAEKEVGHVEEGGQRARCTGVHQEGMAGP